jgi:hypothetical protein
MSRNSVQGWIIRLHAYGPRMSDPRPESPSDPSAPDGAPAENPSGAAFSDMTGPGEALEINPDVPLINPAGD